MKRYFTILTTLLLFITVSCSKENLTEEEPNLPGQEEPAPETPSEPEPDPDYVVDYSPVTETTDKYDITYQYKEDVRILNDVAQKYIVDVEADSILYFSLSTPAEILPEQGMVVAAKITDKTPYGLGNKVISMTKEPDRIKCVTTTAALDDIFQELKLKSNFSFTDFLADDFTKTRVGLEIGSLELITLKLESDFNSPIFAEGNINLGGIFTFNVDLGDGSFETSFTVGLQLDGKVGIKGELPSDDPYTDFMELKKLLEIIKRKQIFSAIIPIAGGAIVLRPHIFFESFIAGALEGKLELGIDQQFIYKIGWTQDGTISENLSNNALTDAFKSIDIQGKIKLGVVDSFGLGLGLFTTNLGMNVKFEPSFLVGAEMGAGLEKDMRVLVGDQKVTADLDLDLKGEIYVNLFNLIKYNYEINLVKVNIAHQEKSIFPDSPQLLLYKLSSNPLNYQIAVEMNDNSFFSFLAGTPTLIIETEDGEVVQIVDESEWSTIYRQENTYLRYVFNVNNLSQNIKYKAIPGMKIGPLFYYWKYFDVSDYSEASIKLSNITINSSSENQGNYIYNATLTFDVENAAAINYWAYNYKYVEGGVEKEYSSGRYFPEQFNLQDGPNYINKTFDFKSPNVRVEFTPIMKQYQHPGPDEVQESYTFNFIYTGK